MGGITTSIPKQPHQRGLPFETHNPDPIGVLTRDVTMAKLKRYWTCLFGSLGLAKMLWTDIEYHLRQFFFFFRKECMHALKGAEQNKQIPYPPTRLLL